MSVRSFAAWLGVSDRMVSTWEAGTVPGSHRVVWWVVPALGHKRLVTQDVADQCGGRVVNLVGSGGRARQSALGVP